MFSKKLIFVLILGGFVFAESWVAKIDGKTISVSDFQNYVNVQKESQGKGGAPISELIEDPEDLSALLQNFIDLQVMLLQAKKAGYTRDNEKVKKIYSEQKGEFVQRMFMLRELAKISPNVSVEQKDLDAVFAKNNRSPGKTFNDLDESTKQQVYQMAVMEKMQVVKKQYMKQLEKIYKVQRSKTTDYYVAVVNEKKFKQSELGDELDKQLRMAGISKEAIEKEQPAKIEEMRKELLDDMIFQEMVSREIIKTKFEAKNEVKLALAFLQDQIAVQYFIEQEIVAKIEVGIKEVEAAYNQQKASLQGMPFDEVQRYLTENIREQKKEKKIANYLTEMKEEAVISRNKEELKNIK